jgi:hypothetical protein
VSSPGRAERSSCWPHRSRSAVACRNAAGILSAYFFRVTKCLRSAAAVGGLPSSLERRDAPGGELAGLVAVGLG